MLISKNPALLAFESVASRGTTHAAAKALGLSQTGVTQRLKALERELGQTLFLRSRRGMALTDEGKALLQLCRAGRELEGEYQSRVGGEGRSEVSLTIVGPTSALSRRVARDVLPVYAQFPFLRLHLRAEDHEDEIELIRRGEADLAVVCPEDVPNEMESKRLRADRYFLVASAKWKGRRLVDIVEKERAIDFYESDPTTQLYILRHTDIRRRLRGRIFANENHALLELLLAGVGYATLAESVASPYLKDGRLILLNGGQVMEDQLALVWYPRPQKSDYFAAVVRRIR